MPGKNNMKAIGQNNVQEITAKKTPIAQRRTQLCASHPFKASNPLTAKINSASEKGRLRMLGTKCKCRSSSSNNIRESQTSADMTINLAFLSWSFIPLPHSWFSRVIVDETRCQCQTGRRKKITIKIDLCSDSIWQLSCTKKFPLFRCLYSSGRDEAVRRRSIAQESPHDAVALARITQLLEISPDIGCFSAEANRDVFVKAANGLGQKRVEFDTFFRRIPELSIGSPFNKVGAMELLSPAPVSGLGEPEMAGKQSQHSQSDILRRDRSHN